MKNYGLVSIVTPNFNCSQFIESTIRSVQAQTYQNWEMLIQDDCSTDDSLQKAMKMAVNDPRIKVEGNPVNLGAAVTRNNAIRRSKGVWLAFLDSDDLWLPDKLEKQLELMEKEGVNMCFCRYEHITPEGTSLGVQAKAKHHITHAQMLVHCWTGCLTVIYKQDLGNKWYGVDVKKANDYALFLEVMKHQNEAIGLDECLAMYRIRKGSVSRSKWKKLEPQLQVLKTVEGIPYLIGLILTVINMAIKYIWKYKKITPRQSVASMIVDLGNPSS